MNISDLNEKMLVSMPSPVKAKRRHAILSRRRTHPISVRFHELDVKLINDMAKFYDVTPSALIRWVTLHAIAEMSNVDRNKYVKVML